VRSGCDARRHGAPPEKSSPQVSGHPEIVAGDHLAYTLPRTLLSMPVVVLVARAPRTPNCPRCPARTLCRATKSPGRSATNEPTGVLAPPVDVAPPLWRGSGAYPIAPTTPNRASDKLRHDSYRSLDRATSGRPLT
jgi:hypothetical protein